MCTRYFMTTVCNIFPFFTDLYNVFVAILYCFNRVRFLLPVTSAVKI